MPGIIFLRMTVVGAESVYMVWAESVYIKVAAVGFTAGIPELVSRLALNHVSDTRNIHVCNYDL